MKRLFILSAVSFTALLFIFLAVQTSNAQPSYQESEQDDQPKNTPQPTAAQPPPQEPLQEGQPESKLLDEVSEVDWATVKMEGEENNNFPNVATPIPVAPAAPEDAAPVHSESEEGASVPSVIVAPTPATEGITHVVIAGETLYRIAHSYGISLALLIAANNIQNPSRLQVGQVLIIPDPNSNAQVAIATPEDGAAQDSATQDGETQDVATQSNDNTYTVQRGDKPYEIAQRFGVDVEVLMAVNQISNPRRMNVGQVLTIPHDGVVPLVESTPTPTTLEVDPATPESTDTYVVQRGDKPFEIAQRFGVGVEVLMAVNQISNPRRMNVGQVLTIPHDGVVPVAESTPTPTTLAVDPATPESTDTYVVQRGDKPFEIAQRFGVDVEALMAVNQISNPRRMNVGQVLTIPQEDDTPMLAVTPVPTTLAVEPAASGSTGPYVVQRGDNLSRIARRFGVTIQALIDANNIGNPNRINTGLTLTIPGTTTNSSPEPQTTPQPEVPPEPPVTLQPEVPPEPPVISQPEVPPVSVAVETMAEETNSLPAGDGPFIWPIPLQDGWISKWYRYGHPGIDIILPIGTPIRATADGIVEFSGWNAYGFGNLVVIEHGNGYRSLYGHQSERLVTEGDTVAQGDVIGLVGITGRATHPHLHFEIRQFYTPVDPCDYLPGGCQQ